MAKFRRVLIANRGEIAVRIIRALRELEIESVVVYSDADAKGLAVKMADYCYRLPGNTPAETYLNIPKIIEAIVETESDAVHPGYGFLSENADFVEAIDALNQKFKSHSSQGSTPDTQSNSIPSDSIPSDSIPSDSIPSNSSPIESTLSDSSEGFSKSITSSFEAPHSNLRSVTFIGPSAASMKKLGDKIKARELMTANGVPMVPGLARALRDTDDLRQVAQNLGYPLILKAAAGGGGRGMRVVRKEEEVKEAFEACSREAVAYFGHPEVFCERYIEQPRHVEIQVMFDGHGGGIALFERDCTIQRRHQKLIEEAPSVYLNDQQRKKLCDIGIKAGLAANYLGAGTIEFICESPDHCYFMEMNTRIQVEHPVTEWITGIDLIKLMIEVAQGQKLPIQQSELKIHGHAIEARINAEDPQRGFLPSPGLVKNIRFPAGPFVRVDTHLYPGYEIPSYYDSMVAKLIVWGQTRHEALMRLRRALNDFEIEGIPTTIKFHEALISHPKFVESQITTRFLEETEEWFSHAYAKGEGKASEEEIALLTAVLATKSSTPTDLATDTPQNQDDRTKWQMQGRSEHTWRSL